MTSSNAKCMLPHFIYANQSILSILYASLFLVVMSTTKRNWEIAGLLMKIVFCLLVLLLFVLLILSKGRAGWIGLAAGIYFIGIKRFRLPVLWSKKGWTMWLLFLALVVSFFWIKKESSQGRLLIYKISANIFTDHWLWGIGYGKYKATYNLYQANYFSIHSIDSEEAVLADNTFYAFNDPWQLLIELGLLRFICLACCVVVLLLHFKTYVIKPDRNHVFYTSASALICLIVASLFSYPFQVFSIQFFALLYLVALLRAVEPVKGHVSSAKWLFLFFKFFIKASILFVSSYAIFKIVVMQRAKEASDLSLAGFKNLALERFGLLSNSAKDGTILFAYAQQLYYVNQLKKASVILAKTKNFYINNEVCRLSAFIAQESGDLKRAEGEYMKAVYMVPNRMVNRYELYRFYLAVGDTTKALIWAESILHMPVKIPSEETRNIRKIVGRQQSILQAHND
ncbi:MAG: O-antigen ligase domain-containing protein [Flavobacterium sp.]|nr:MAG: O-antigen ligase domain-containing protein [Flavobacterium sp.]